MHTPHARLDARLALLVAVASTLGACVRPITLLAPSPLSTDRPSFSTGTSVVPMGFPQVEMGLTHTRVDGVSATAIGEATLRAAVAPKLELRVTAPSYVMVRPNGVGADGVTDAALGAKIVLHEPGRGDPKSAPSLSLLVGTTLPTGAEGFKSDRALASSSFILGWAASERVGVTTNLSWGQAEVAGGTADIWTAVLGLGFSHTAKVGSFAEVYSIRDPSGSWDDPWVVGGFTYLATRTLQLDAHGGIRTTNPGDAYFVGFGLARRF